LITESEIDALQLAVRPLHFGPGRFNITLVSIKNMQFHSDLGETLESDLATAARFAVLLQAAFQLDIWNRFDASSSRRCFGAGHSGLSDFDGRAIQEDGIERIFLAKIRQPCVEPSNHSTHGHARIPYHRQQSAPEPVQIIFLGDNSDFRLLVLNFGLEDFCVVGLADIF
jgi:hypothetical protein